MSSLLDRITRHQVYLESVKVGAIVAFNPFHAEAENGIKKEFAILKVGNIGEMTKANLNKFVNLLRGLMKRVFNRYMHGILKLLHRLLRIERIIFNKVFEDADTPDDDTLWSRVRNTVLPSNGQTFENMLDAFADVIEAKVADAVNKGYAQSLSVNAALGILVGSGSELFGQSVLGRSLQQNAALIDTIIQHISEVVQSSVASTIFDVYTWASIVDKGTTPICLERNGKVYKYGKGPLPPAHYRCRATTIPGAVTDLPTSFYGWLRTQPDDNVIDMLGPSVGKAFVNGSTKSSNFMAFAHPVLLTLDDFAGKLDMITA